MSTDKLPIKTEIKKSTIEGAGYGVFATVDICKNEIVCLYGGRVLENCLPFDMDKLKNWDNAEQVHYLIQHTDYTMAFPSDVAKLNFSAFSEKTNIAIFGWKFDDLQKLRKGIKGKTAAESIYQADIETGSMINDYYMPTELSDKELKEYDKKVFIEDTAETDILDFPQLDPHYNVTFKYQCDEIGIARIHFKNNVVPNAIISTKDIKKGEELFVPYGAGYWFWKFRKEQFNKMCKIRNKYGGLDYWKTVDMEYKNYNLLEFIEQEANEQYRFQCDKAMNNMGHNVSDVSNKLQPIECKNA